MLPAIKQLERLEGHRRFGHDPSPQVEYYCFNFRWGCVSLRSLVSYIL
jgi:hypothetical protein